MQAPVSPAAFTAQAPAQPAAQTSAQPAADPFAAKAEQRGVTVVSCRDSLL